MDCTDGWKIFDLLCIDPRIEVGSIITSVIASIGLVSLYLAFQQIRLSRFAQQTQVTIELHKEFLRDEVRTRFIYQLDYESHTEVWKFNPDNFPLSEEERHLDGLLYFLSFVGLLVKNGSLKTSNLIWLRSWVAMILENKEVLKYLNWLKSPDQLPSHESFSGAVYLYEAFYGKNTETYRHLSQYLKKG
jgi:hypothetical protein